MDWKRELAVLMAVRIHGRADAVAAARTAGIREEEAAATLASLQAEAAVEPAASAAALHLTERGREMLAHLLTIEAQEHDQIADRYESFLETDRELKRAITAWQLAAEKEKPAARAEVSAVASRAWGFAQSLADEVPRFLPYAGRLSAAGIGIVAGDGRFVASPRVDSLHQVWFELHEDLLATLGRSRTS